ncbi:MAG: hypothetical protein ACOYEV_00320 [Candidatus Nanopelagicales bacterium]
MTNLIADVRPVTRPALGEPRLAPQTVSVVNSPPARRLSSSGSVGRRLTARDLLIGLLVAVGTIAVGWIWRAALIPIDPWDYVEGALHFPNGIWNAVGLSRWGMIGPLRVFTGWWGDAELAYYAYPLLASGLLGAVLYGLGTRLVNRLTGIAAAFFVLTVPVVFVHLSRGYPDLIAVAFLGLSLLALMLARDAANPHLPAAGGPRTATLAPDTELPAPWLRGNPARSARLTPAVIGWLLLAGGAAGWAFEVRELSVLSYPALAVALYRVGRPRIAVPVFAALPLVTVVVDVALSARYFGDPLLKLHALSGNSIAQSIVARDAVYIGHDRWFYLTVPFSILGSRSGGFLLLGMAGLGLIAGAIHFRKLSPVWLWGASVFVLLWLAGGALSPRAPAIRLDIVRYNLAYLVPLLLTGICVLGIWLVRSTGWTRRALQATTLTAVALALLPSVRFAANFEGLAPNGGNALRGAATFLSSQSDIPEVHVWADWGTQRLLPVYTRKVVGGPQQWAPQDFFALNRIARKDFPAAERPQPGDYIVVFSQNDETCYHCARALEEVEAVFGVFPLPGWKQVYSAPTGNLEIYQLPPGYIWPDRRGGSPAGPVVPGTDNGQTDE